ncbi:MAG: DUF5679 domain-containing protein [Roseiflexaceae bacterium]
MIPKRIFWLTCVAIAGWLIWMRLRQRQDDFANTTPQFAPPRTFVPATPAAVPQPAQPAPAAAKPAPVPPVDTTSDNWADHGAEADSTAEIDISGYCMRCKTKREIQNAHRETTESGRPAARGSCPVCGANMFTFLATNDA